MAWEAATFELEVLEGELRLRRLELEGSRPADEVQASVNAEAIVWNVRKVLEISEYIYILDQGRVRFEGPKEQFTDEDELVELYLGRRTR